MSIDYEALLKYVENQKKSEDECCLICYLGDKDECNQLSCSHYFHEDCLGNLKNCPYCDKKIKKINKNIKNIKTNIKNDNICKIILKTGKRKGDECGRINCGYHK